MAKSKKERLRERIDRLDDRILDLLNRRAKLAIETKNYKKDCYDPERERAITDRLTARNEGPLPDGSLRAVYNEILSACRALQKPVAVAFLGPEATFSHSAALARFGASIIRRPCPDIESVFDEVEKGLADFGVVPIENSTGGVVTATLDRVSESTASVCGEIFLEIQLCLLSRAKSLDRIKKVYTHVQPLEQCSDWVKSQSKKWEFVQVSSSAEAACLAARTAASAAIASRLAADIYGLNVLERRIENVRDNKTRFLVIGSARTPPTGKDKTSIVFTVRHEPGTLYRALKAFEKHGINLTMIQARPSRRAPWEYIFFLDLQGHAADPLVASALRDMKKETVQMKIIGSYPESPQ
ncbi:MAG: prephenate dehydratase [bacterium]